MPNIYYFTLRVLNGEVKYCYGCLILLQKGRVLFMNIYKIDLFIALDVYL